MNDNDFEKKLQSLTGALHRPDPTPAWKADILARARREAEAIPFKRMLPPRWLMFSWAACWLITIGLHSMTPDESRPGITGPIAAFSTDSAEVNPLTGHNDVLLAMLAQNESTFVIPHP